MQELLRHGSSRITMDVYAQAVDAGQAQGAGEGSGDAAGHHEGKELRLKVVCPREKTGFPASALFCWRPRRDLNPCYRRERTSQAFLHCFVRVCLE